MTRGDQSSKNLRMHGQNEPPLPANYDNFVGQENNYGCKRDPGGQSVASEEVQGHAYPAREPGYQRAADIRHSDSGREMRAVKMPKPENLTKCPDNNKELNRDSYLGPTFSSHGKNCSRIGTFC
jgi:hypothetical protein